MRTILIYFSTTLALLANLAPGVSNRAVGQDQAENRLPDQDPNIVLNLLPERWYGKAPRIRPKKGFELGAAPAYVKPDPISMAELDKMTSRGVSVAEVNDYVFGGYEGELSPGAPHADLNPKKAFIVFWKAHPYRLVFWHEASYCPIIELPSGAGANFQFFEGNDGKYELFNTPGRRESNTFVEVLEGGPERVWVRWHYTCVNVKTGEAGFRGTEDFVAYPNGLVHRRQTFLSLQPGNHHGYGREPIDYMGMCPVGKLWKDVLYQTDPVSGECCCFAFLDAFSAARQDVYWTPRADHLWASTARRSGASIDDVNAWLGSAQVIPLRDGPIFCIFGDASGYHHRFTRFRVQSFIDDPYSNNWGSITVDHWPIGWLNSQVSVTTEETLKKYPNHFAPAAMDIWALTNEEAERGVYYSLIGVGTDPADLEDVRAIAGKWLGKGTGVCNRAESVADLR